MFKNPGSFSSFHESVLGTSIVEHSCVFTKDEKSVLTVHGRDVHMCSVDGGVLEGQLCLDVALKMLEIQNEQLMEGQGNVCGMGVDEASGLMYVCHDFGMVIVWSLETGQPNRYMRLGRQALFMTSSGPAGEFGLFVLGRSITDSGDREVLFYEADGKEWQVVAKTSELIETLRCGGLTRDLTVYSFVDNMVMMFSKQGVNRIRHSRRIRSLDVSLDNEILAIGDVKGQIWINYVSSFRNNGESEWGEFRERRLFHWHANGVGALRFMANGNYLVSGGEESVLVVWQMKTGKPEFLPRLGGCIQQISVSPRSRYYGVSCSDNTIKVVSVSNLDVVSAIVGIKWCGTDRTKTRKRGERGRHLGFVVDPNGQSLVGDGDRGYVQFYDVNRRVSRRDIDITGQNRVSRFGREEVPEFRVQFVRFVSTWMVTLDSRTAKNGDVDMFLRFWELENSEYVLKTRIDVPHDDEMTLMETTDAGMLVLTGSKDRHFKTWIFSGEQWRSCSAGTYRSLVPMAGSFSVDGTLAAIQFADSGTQSWITVWDPVVTNLVHVVSFHVYPEMGGVFRGMRQRYWTRFLPGSSVLLTFFVNSLMICDVLTGEKQYLDFAMPGFETVVTALTTHPQLGLFALGLSSIQNNVSKHHVVVWKKDALEPVHVHPVPNSVLDLVFFPGEFRLYVFDSKQRVLLISEREDDAPKKRVSKRETARHPRPAPTRPCALEHYIEARQKYRTMDSHLLPPTDALLGMELEDLY